MVIMLVALIVLGPEQLPKAVRSVSNVMAELRRLSGSFQDEMRNALDTDSSKPSKGSGTPSPGMSSEVVARNPAEPAMDPGDGAPATPEPGEDPDAPSGGADAPAKAGDGPGEGTSTPPRPPISAADRAAG